MSEDETVEFLEHIKNVFEYINTSSESIQIWDKALKQATLGQAKKCFEEYILTSNKTPKPYDIYKIWNEHQENKKIEQSEIKNESYCELCSNTGLVRYYQEHKNIKEKYLYEYLCQCVCDVAKQYENLFPKITQKIDLTELKKYAKSRKKLVLVEKTN